jgi:hypothetical protein
MTKENGDEQIYDVEYLVVETFVGTEHHSATRQTFFHSSFVSFLFRRTDSLEAMRTFDNAVWTIDLVDSKMLAKDRSFAVLTIRNFKLTLLIVMRYKVRKGTKKSKNKQAKERT